MFTRWYKHVMKCQSVFWWVETNFIASIGTADDTLLHYFGQGISFTSEIVYFPHIGDEGSYIHCALKWTWNDDFRVLLQFTVNPCWNNDSKRMCKGIESYLTLTLTSMTLLLLFNIAFFDFQKLKRNNFYSNEVIVIIQVHFAITWVMFFFVSKI